MSQLLRILLVADDPDVIRRIGHGLQLDHPGLVQVDGADSLATARRRLSIAAYDLALVELALGNGKGLHLLSHLRDIAPELPLVALAALDSDPDAAACVALGAHDRLAPEAMDSPGVLDRLQNAAARAREGMRSRQRSTRLADSLGGAACLAWRYEHGEGEVWLAAADPTGWHLPAPECRESLEALRGRIHPDDRELVLRQLEERLATDEPWNLDARLKAGGEAYRWCTLRGRSKFDERGQLEHVSGVVSDAQREHKRLRELEQNRRFLRAAFDSAPMPQAVLDAAGVIVECNAAWLMLDDPACHAGTGFAPGRRFIDQPAKPDAFGDLDTMQLARGVKQILGGVTDHFSCDYGDGDRRWRFTLTPLLNPGIAGAIVCHEEMTASCHVESSLRASVETAELDLATIPGPLFRLAPDFGVRAANAAGESVGRAPVIGRDILKVLPRLHADAVSDGLASIAAGASSAVRDSRPVDGLIMRWLLTAQHDSDGRTVGMILHGLDITDLALRNTRPEPGLFTVAVADDHEVLVASQAEVEQLRATLAEMAGAREAMRTELKETQRREAATAHEHGKLAENLETARAERGELAENLEIERAERDKLAKTLEAEQARRDSLAEALAAQQTERQQLVEWLAAKESGIDALTAALEAERAKHRDTVAALAAADLVPVRLRAALDKARQDLHVRIDELVERAFEPLLDSPLADEPGEAPEAHQHSEAL